MRTIVVPLVLASALAASSALAQVSTGDAALAEKLFDDARQLMAKKSYAEACPKLAESERLDPGIGTLLNLGECYEKSGKLASAWATYREAEGASVRKGQKKRAVFAAGRVKALEPSLSYLVVDVPANVAARVTCDGRAVGAPSLGTPMPLDAGTHRLEATAPGRRRWSQDIDLSVKATVRVSIELALEDVVAVTSPPAAVTPPPPHATTEGRSQRVIGLVAGGVGLVGLGVGSYFGLSAKRTYDDADAHCSARTCTPEGGRLTSDARGQATASTVLFAVGAGALVLGVVLWVTAPRASKSARFDGFRF